MLSVFRTEAQYYLRGSVRDEAGMPLANVKILLASSGYVYYSGSSGSFGITSSRESDSAFLSLDGYYSCRIVLNASAPTACVMKAIASHSSIRKPGLSSITKGLPFSDQQRWTVGTETYSNLIENSFVPANKFPETGFSVNIHKASYSNIRRFLNMDSKVPPDAVRMEEVMNYFNFNYKPPVGDSLWKSEFSLTDCPWHTANKLLFMQLFARKLDFSALPPANLVFLIDISGSMDMPNRLPLLKSAFRLMVENLRTIDTVSIVVYGGTVGVWLPPTSGGDKKAIQKAIEELTPGGATPGASGILAAYRIAESQFIKGGNNRVILATDGDFNVGQTSDKDLEELIVRNRMAGIYLTCLGVGMGNYKDSKLEMLAKRGNGNFAYLDDEREAEKVLVKEFTQTLYCVASDVYLNLKFNPDVVSAYRLIGFDNKLKDIPEAGGVLEGGEVGSGHALMAVVELEMQPTHTQLPRGEIPDLLRTDLSFKMPGDTAVHRICFPVNAPYKPFAEMDPQYRFAASLVLFGSILRSSPYIKGKNFNDVLTMASQAMDKNDPLHTEFLTLVEKAKKIYYSRKKRKRED